MKSFYVFCLIFLITQLYGINKPVVSLGSESSQNFILYDEATYYPSLIKDTFFISIKEAFTSQVILRNKCSLRYTNYNKYAVDPDTLSSLYIANSLSLSIRFLPDHYFTGNTTPTYIKSNGEQYTKFANTLTYRLTKKSVHFTFSYANRFSTQPTTLFDHKFTCRVSWVFPRWNSVKYKTSGYITLNHSMNNHYNDRSLIKNVKFKLEVIIDLNKMTLTDFINNEEKNENDTDPFEDF